MSNDTADLIVAAGTVHAMAMDAPVTVLAIRDGRIAATAGPDDRRDLLAAWRGPDTVVIDDPGLVVLPAFVDTHNHLMLAAQNILGVPVSQAADIPELVQLIRERAARTPPGQWIRTAADWHELRLAERRLPTAAELDEATTDHPVLLQRGGHNGVLNSAGLRLAGIGRGTTDLEGGFIDRDAAGYPRGWVQDAALELAQRVVPALPERDLIDGLGRASASYAAHGIGTVRDAAVTPAQWHAYVRAQAAGRLSVRCHAMMMTTPAVIAAAGSVDAYLDSLERQGIKPGAGEGLLRVWGLKFVLDGGVEAAAMTRPYADRPGYLGELMWDRDALAAALAACARRGWPVGTHAMGDHAVGTLLDAIGDARAQVGDAPPGMFVVEHGGLIGGHIARAVGLGVHVTVQQALLDGLAPAFLAAWGQDRTAALFPWRGLVDGGAWISAGTDHPIGPLSPLRAVGGMTTRATPAGVLGPEHAISRQEALRLYTVAGARFLGGETAGALVPGAPADLVAYRADPFTCPDEQLPGLSPTATVIGGLIAYQRS
ncbi:MAG TPA: amidohydrolase [Trebonia sp.]|nr:amidohydrolase [Trebonia sp.]